MSPKTDRGSIPVLPTEFERKYPSPSIDDNSIMEPACKRPKLTHGEVIVIDEDEEEDEGRYLMSDGTLVVRSLKSKTKPTPPRGDRDETLEEGQLTQGQPVLGDNPFALANNFDRMFSTRAPSASTPCRSEDLHLPAKRQVERRNTISAPTEPREHRLIAPKETSVHRRDRSPDDKAGRMDFIESKIGYRFTDRDILWEALQPEGTEIRIGDRHVTNGNHRLALIGDRVNEQILAEDWYNTADTEGSETPDSFFTLRSADSIAGQYSRASTTLLSNRNLARVALTANLHTATAGREMHGERPMGTRVEAIVGAVYLDSGSIPHHVKKVLKRLGLCYEDLLQARPRASLGGIFGASNDNPIGVSVRQLQVSRYVRALIMIWISHRPPMLAAHRSVPATLQHMTPAFGSPPMATTGVGAADNSRSHLTTKRACLVTI